MGEERMRRYYHYTTLPALEEIAESRELKPAAWTLAPNFSQTRTGLPDEQMEVAIVIDDSMGIPLNQDPNNDEWFYTDSTISFGAETIKILLPWQQEDRIKKGYTTLTGLIDEAKRRREYREALEPLLEEWHSKDHPIKE